MPRALQVSNRGGHIPGISGRRVPGGARMPRVQGGLLTRVPRQSTSGKFREAHFQQVRDSQGRFAGGWGYAWTGLAATSERLIQWNNNLHENVAEIAERVKNEMVEWAQSNAPWTDQTGNARAGLQGVVVWDDSEHFTIFLSHGDDIFYGVWLEVRWGGRYSILVPTMHEFAPRLAAEMRSIS